MSDYDELAAHARATTNGHHQDRAEGKDLLEAAIIAVEKAAYWENPKTYHEGMFETGVKMATLRANVALAVELRELRTLLARIHMKELMRP